MMPTITQADALAFVDDYPSPYMNPEAVADALGYSTETMYTLKHQGKMPNPDMIQSNVPLWLKATIKNWIKTTDRPKTGRPKADT